MRAALASLNDQTVRVAVVQDKAAKSADNLESSTEDLAKAEEKAAKAYVTKRAALLRATDLEGKVRVEREKTTKAAEDEADAIIAHNEALIRDAASRKAQWAIIQQQAKDRVRINEQLRKSDRRLADDQSRMSIMAADHAKRWAAMEDGRASASEKAARRIARAQGGGGGGGGRSGGMFGAFHPTQNLAGFDFGRAGIKPRSVGILGAAGGAIGLIKPLTDVLGLLGAVPAAAGAAGIAIAAFHSLGSKAINKTVADQQKATEKFKAGTIDAKAYHKAMTNALIGLSAEQKKALPFFREWHDLSKRTSEVMAHKMLPALGDLGRALKDLKQPIVTAFGRGAGSIAAGMTGIGSFLQTNRGQRGAGALASSSANMLSGFSSASVNLFKSFLDIARAARPLVDKLADDMTRVTAKFAAFTGSFSGQQRMRQWFLDSEVAAKKFLAVVGNVGQAIKNIGGGVGSGFLDWLVKITEQFQQWTEVPGNVDRVAVLLKRMADTLLVIGQGMGVFLQNFAKLTELATKTLGPNTMGWLFLGKMAGGGALLKVLGKGIGSSIGGKAAGSAAAGAGGAAAGGGAGGLAGLLGGTAALAGVAAAVVGIGAGIGFILLMSSKSKEPADELSKSWDRVKGSIDRAGAAAKLVSSSNASQRVRVANLATLKGSEPGARMGLFDAKQQLANDKAALKGMDPKGKDAQRMRIQIEVDSAQVVTAREELAKLRAAIASAKDETNRHADDSREAGRAVQDSATKQVNALEQVTDAAKQSNAVFSNKSGASARRAAEGVQEFTAKMNAAASSLEKSNPKAANYARTAALLAKNLKSIPSSRDVNVFVHGVDTALYSLHGLIGLLASIKDKHVRVSVTQSVGSINPVGRPAPRMAGGKIDEPMTIIGEQAPMHPEFVIATNPAYRARNQKLMGEAARSMGGEVNFFAQGGVLGGGKATPGTSGKTTFPGGGMSGRMPPAAPGAAAADPRLSGINAALGMAAAYSAGGTAAANAAAAAAAAHYAGIPGQIGKLKHEMARLHIAIRGDDKFLEGQDDLLVNLRAQKTREKDAAKKAKLTARINHIVHDVLPPAKSRRKGKSKHIDDDQKLIDKLTAEYEDLVPGESGFQDLIATLEGQQSAASELHRDDLVSTLKSREADDYRKRIAFLIAFTGAKSTQANRAQFAAASSALGSDKQALNSLLEVDSGGSSSGDSGSTASQDADKDQALAMLAELAQWARQGQLSDLLGADQLDVAMDFISKTVGSFAKGSPFIAKGGLAEVHYGEAIVPAWQNKQGGAAAPSEATLTLQGSDDLTRALAKALGGQVNIQLGRESRRRMREGVRS